MSSPQRIVSLISSATEILYLLGLGERVVGVSHECDHPPEVAAKPRLTRSLVASAASSRAIDDQVRALAGEQSALYEIDVAALAELKPDLIITQAQCDVCAVRYEDVMDAVRSTPALRAAQVLALNPRELSEVLADVAKVGQATRSEQAARAAIEALTARIAAVEARTRALPAGARLRVACLEWLDPPMLAANWMPQMIALAGGHSDVAGGRHSGYADWSRIARFDPQVAVLMPCGFDLERTIVEAQVLAGVPEWPRLAAVRSARVYAVDGNAYFNRSGPRLVDSLEILAHLLHPELFPPPWPAEHRVWRRLTARDGALQVEEQ